MKESIKRFMKILVYILVALSFVYIVMLTNTNHLMKEVRNVFLWEVPTEDTLGRAINTYNDYDLLDNVALGEVKLFLVRLFVFHNFKDGYIWAYYNYAAYDETGHIITGSWGVPTKWIIHKENGKWEITEIIEPV